MFAFQRDTNEHSQENCPLQEEFEDTKGVVRINNSKDRQDNGEKGVAICIFMYNEHCILFTLGTELRPVIQGSVINSGNGITRILYTTSCQVHDQQRVMLLKLLIMKIS